MVELLDAFLEIVIASAPNTSEAGGIEGAHNFSLGL